MKKIFNSLLLVILFPFSLFKNKKRKTGKQKDNFLSGLILGALLSLLINMMSIKIQGAIDRQRVLESIENEIRTNQLIADLNINLAMRQRNQNANQYIRPQEFTKDVWQQSIEPLLFISTLPNNIQASINTFYSLLIPHSNNMNKMLADEYTQEMIGCFDYGKILSPAEQKLCNDKYHLYLINVAQYISADVANESTEILKLFHPTKDRLNNPLLRLFMGTEGIQTM